MTQQQPPQSRTGATSSGLETTHLIEKGWTVLDKIERPIGNVTDVDASRGLLVIDGRAQGIGTFEVPLNYVESTSSEEVHLSKSLVVGTTGEAPRFEDQPDPVTSAASERPRARSRIEAVPTGAAPGTTSIGPSTRPLIADTSNRPANADTMSQFAPPYAVTGMNEPASAWPDNQQEGGWGVTRIATTGVAVGGLAAAAYLMRQRMRRKSAFERLVETAGGYFEGASDLARNRHPAWWASLAATALPLAYYAWPSPKPTATQQARAHADDLSGQISAYLGEFAGQMPGYLRTGRDLAWDWSPRPDVAGTFGALAAGALAIFLLRRTMSKPTANTRIADVMTRRPRVIQPDATVADAAAMMRSLDVGALPVCDGTRLIGMLTDRDITIRSTADGRDPHLTPVRDVMSAGVAWANEDDLVDEAARIMREHRIRRLPIVDERHSLVGVVSLGDLAVDVANDKLSGDTLEQISEKTQKPREKVLGTRE